MENVKTSVILEKSLYKKIKILSIELEIPLSKLLNEAISDYIKKVGV